MTTTLPTDSADRKDVPLARGLLDYFPAALAAVARLSLAGNEKHNPGEELHHARGKSTDHADCILRHLTERGSYDEDGFLHDVKVAWRALAQLQEALEVNEGAPLPRGARSDDEWLDHPEVVAMREKIRVAVLGVLDEDADTITHTPEDFEPEFDEYGRLVGPTVPPITFTEDEHGSLAPCRLDDGRCSYTGKPVDCEDDCVLDALDARTDTSLPESVVDALYLTNAVSNRIAGDTDEAKAIKNPYYNHNPFEIRGYCANCDTELTVDDEALCNNPGFDGSVLFCSLNCRLRLLEWQGRNR